MCEYRFFRGINSGKLCNRVCARKLLGRDISPEFDFLNGKIICSKHLIILRKKFDKVGFLKTKSEALIQISPEEIKIEKEIEKEVEPKPEAELQVSPEIKIEIEIEPKPEAEKEIEKEIEKKAELQVSPEIRKLKSNIITPLEEEDNIEDNFNLVDLIFKSLENKPFSFTKGSPKVASSKIKSQKKKKKNKLEAEDDPFSILSMLRFQK